MGCSLCTVCEEQQRLRSRRWCGCGFVWRSVGVVVSRLRHEAVYIEMWWWAAACGRAGGGGGWIREVAAPIIIFIVVVGVMVVGGGRARVKSEGFECRSQIVGGWWRAALGEPEDFGGDGGAGFESVHEAVTDVAGATDAW